MDCGFTPLQDQAKSYFREPEGLLVTEVWIGRPASKAGIRPGDILVLLNGQRLKTTDDLSFLVAPLAQIDRELTLRREGKTLRAVLVANGRPAETKGERFAFAGLELAAPVRGVTLTDVAPDSVAYQAGLRSGDRLLRVAGTDTSNAVEVRRMFARKKNQPVFLTFERDSSQRGVFLP